VARIRKSLSLTKRWRFHNNVYVDPREGLREDLKQLLRGVQQSFVHEVGLEFAEIVTDFFAGVNGNFPENEAVSGNVLKRGVLFLLDRILEGTNSLIRGNFDLKDAGARLASHQTIQCKN
jgi:hypothetical protein